MVQTWCSYNDSFFKGSHVWYLYDSCLLHFDTYMYTRFECILPLHNLFPLFSIIAVGDKCQHGHERCSCWRHRVLVFYHPEEPASPPEGSRTTWEMRWSCLHVALWPVQYGVHQQNQQTYRREDQGAWTRGVTRACGRIGGSWTRLWSWSPS